MLLIFASVIDLFAGVLNLIPYLGTVADTTLEALLEVTQILLATFLALNR